MISVRLPCFHYGRYALLWCAAHSVTHLMCAPSFAPSTPRLPKNMLRSMLSQKKQNTPISSSSLPCGDPEWQRAGCVRLRRTCYIRGYAALDSRLRPSASARMTAVCIFAVVRLSHPAPPNYPPSLAITRRRRNKTQQSVILAGRRGSRYSDRNKNQNR